MAPRRMSDDTNNKAAWPRIFGESGPWWPWLPERQVPPLSPQPQSGQTAQFNACHGEAVVHRMLPSRRKALLANNHSEKLLNLRRRAATSHSEKLPILRRKLMTPSQKTPKPNGRIVSIQTIRRRRCPSSPQITRPIPSGEANKRVHCTSTRKPLSLREARIPLWRQPSRRL